MEIRFEAHQRLCYYPSCHHRTPWILLNLDCDFFIMSEKDRRASRWQDFRASFGTHGREVELVEDRPDYLHFRSEGRPVWVFREDNRQTLARIGAAGLRIHHFVGIRDGCMEGGNHECVNAHPFLSHLLPLAAEDMTYTTDHVAALQPTLYWNQRRKFRSGTWSDFCTAEPSRRAPESGVVLPGAIRFDLQGVLVKVDDALRVLPLGPEGNGLERFRAFRHAYGIGIIAEYRVRRHDPYAEEMLLLERAACRE